VTTHRPATVGVVLSNYNHARYLPESLGAICGQSRPADEILIVDDGSTDDSLAVIEDFARREPAVRVVQNERNLGLQASIARALPLINSEYLVWAAADDRLLPEFLERSVPPLERHPGAGLCFSELAVLKGDRGNIERFAAVPAIAHIFDLSDLPEYLTPEAVRRRMRRAYLPITSNSVVVRRDALLALGGYPGELQWYADSFAYTVIALRHGACVVPQTLSLIRSVPGSYSHQGMRDPERQAAVLDTMLEILARPEYRDVRRAFRRAPSNFSPGHHLMLRAQSRRVRDWDLFLPYLWWNVRDYRRAHGLGWGGTAVRLAEQATGAVIRVVAHRLKRRRRRRPGRGYVEHTPPGAYTLLVLTYDRPAMLSRLLDYLERQGADFPVIVLDSSHAEAGQANARRIARSPLSIRHSTHSPDLHPFLKLRAGADLVATPTCSVCADDDLVILPALRRCVVLLARRPDVAVVHGQYFNFSETDTFTLSAITYRSPSLLHSDPLPRLYRMFADYEAVFYGVQRTEMLRAAFRRVAEVHTLLGRELVTAALTALAGKIVRIDDLYYGRSTGESLFYESWHPYQILVEAPERLLEDYGRLKPIVLAALRDGPPRDRAPEAVETIVDLVFLRYLAPFLRSDVIDLIIADELSGLKPSATFEHVWEVAVRRVLDQPRPDAVPLMGELGARFAPGERGAKTRRRDYVATSATAAGGARTYRLCHEFLFPDPGQPAAVGREELRQLLSRLDAYCS